MKSRLTPYYINLVYEACLKSFWRKSALRNFLRECKISENFLATWSEDETKRNFLDRLFEKLPRTDNGRLALLKMAKFLMEQRSFPDLQNWEDSKEKIKAAIEEASGDRTPLLLLDHSHLYYVLIGIMGIADVVNRVRRHASQTGEAYLPVDKFSG